MDYFLRNCEGFVEIPGVRVNFEDPFYEFRSSPVIGGRKLLSPLARKLPLDFSELFSLPTGEGLSLGCLIVEDTDFAIGHAHRLAPRQYRHAAHVDPPPVELHHANRRMQHVRRRMHDGSFFGEVRDEVFYSALCGGGLSKIGENFGVEDRANDCAIERIEDHRLVEV